MKVGDRVRVLAIGGVEPDGIIGQLATVTSVANQEYLHAELDETDVSRWVCEDRASWIEDMHALRELFVGLP